MKKRCVIFVAIKAFALTNSRLLLMKHFLSSGWKVVAITSEDHAIQQLANSGVCVEKVNFRRGGFSFAADLKVFFTLLKLYRRHRPSLIHHFNGKPIIFGSIASFFVRGAKVVNTITGLGYPFIHKEFSSYAFIAMLRILSKRISATIFQNSSNYELFANHPWFSRDKSFLIISSGVDTKRFVPVSRLPKSNMVIMVARLVWMKGVREYVEAAERIKKTMPDVQCELAGEIERIHPDAIPESWLQNAVASGAIQYLGFISNIEQVLSCASVCVLPSYEEGAPRILLEASACGIPVVATDVAGCRDVVEDGVTGFLVPKQDSAALAQAIIKIINDPVLAEKMGKAGREKIEKEFDLQTITDKHLAVYRRLGCEV